MKIHAIMIALPDATLQKIPFPPRMRALPAPILEKFRSIALNKSLSLAEKIKKGKKVYNSLTAAQKALLPTVAEIYQLVLFKIFVILVDFYALNSLVIFETYICH